MRILVIIWYIGFYYRVVFRRVFFCFFGGNFFVVKLFKYLERDFVFVYVFFRDY